MAVRGPIDANKKNQLAVVKLGKMRRHFRSLRMTGLTVDVARSS
jgi:hypothetical protein